MTLPRLDRRLVGSDHVFPPDLLVGPRRTLPVRVLQFGGGNFLRCFADRMIDRMNAAGLFDGGVVIVQRSEVETLNAQGGCYTVVSRGVSDGETVVARQLVTSVVGAVNPDADPAAYARIATGADLRFVVSNTTEAGIVYSPDPYTPGVPQRSFPARVCALLAGRHRAFDGAPDKGLIFLPCELIAANGATLRDIVLRHAADWELGAAFVAWVKDANIFCDTLVDCIVPGHPGDEAGRICEELGYRDDLLALAEPFHLWAIQGPACVAEEFPAAKAGFNVIRTDDVRPFRALKVAVLNGAHTAAALTGFLAGLDTVGEVMADPATAAFVTGAVYDEILPASDAEEPGKKAYAADVLDRFRNPFVRHRLSDIALNSVSKWKVRVLPSLKNFRASTGRLPDRLAFSLAALLHFYRGERGPDGAFTGLRAGVPYAIRDDAGVLAAFAEAASQPDTGYISRILGNTALWGEDLRQIPGLESRVADDFAAVSARGIRAALAARPDAGPESIAFR